MPTVTRFCKYAGGMGLVVFLVVLGGCRQRGADVSQTDEGQLVLGTAERTEAVDRGVELAGRTLVLDGFQGTVALSGADVQEASLVFTKRARGRSDEQAAGLLGQITIEETGDAQTYTYTLRTREPSRSSVDVQGVVPRATALHLRLGSGGVTLSAIDGPLDVTVDNGDVAIGGAGAGVSVAARNGSVDLGLMRLPAGSEVLLRTVNGNLTLTLPGRSNARVEAQTAAGAITTEGLTFTKKRLNPDGAGARFQGQLGAGGASVTLRTENGAIALKQGTVRRLPPRFVPAPLPDGSAAADSAAADSAAADSAAAADSTALPARRDTLRPR